MFRKIKGSTTILTNQLETFKLIQKKYLFQAVKIQSCSLHSRNPEYIQESIVPTLHFQDSLPRLPIPELVTTCDRYIAALKPITEDTKLQNTIKVVEKFKSEEGKELQAELIAINKRNKHTSYISGPWFDYYLKSRSPVVLNFNPFLAFKDDPKPKYNSQLIRSTNMLISTLRFMKSLRASILEPEVFHLNPQKSDTTFFRKVMRLMPKPFAWYGAYLFKAFPLDMSQFNNLFNSTRIPRLNKDEIVAFPEARHVVVLRNGYFYVFDAIDGDGNIMPHAHLYNHIKYILSDTRPAPSHPISLLTTENRDTWAEVRDYLEKLGNAEQLRLIDSAIFVLSLDEETLGDDSVKSAHHMLHGPVHNRWFDKSFTLIVTKDGKAAINFEHSWGDGVAVLRYFNEIYDDSTKNHFVDSKTVPANVDASQRVQRLDFRLDESVRSAVKQAQEKFKQTSSNLKLDVLLYDKLHRDNIKNYKLSPDSVAQLGFQMAYYKIYGNFVATYESCSTSAFKHGRTETVRPATMATKKFVEEYHKHKKVSHSELRGFLNECTKVHNKLTKEAALGQGFDRHLFGLRYVVEKMGKPVPALYTDPVYSEANHFILSTSTLYGPAFSGGGFAPVVSDGFGIGYGFLENQMGFLVSSYSPYRDGKGFIDALRESFDNINEVLIKS